MELSHLLKNTIKDLYGFLDGIEEEWNERARRLYLEWLLLLVERTCNADGSIFLLRLDLEDLSHCSSADEVHYLEKVGRLQSRRLLNYSLILICQVECLS